MIGPGSINAWNCLQCHKNTVAIHIDEGVTPMMLRCRRTQGCEAMAVSSMYPDPPIPEYIVDNLEWEWFRPVDFELSTLDEDMREHVERGGLVLRPLTDAGRALIDTGVAR